MCGDMPVFEEEVIVEEQPETLPEWEDVPLDVPETVAFTI